MKRAGPVGESQPDLYQTGADGERSAGEVQDQTAAARPVIIAERRRRIIGEVMGFFRDEPQKRGGEGSEMAINTRRESRGRAAGTAVFIVVGSYCMGRSGVMRIPQLHFTFSFLLLLYFAVFSVISARERRRF